MPYVPQKDRALVAVRPKPTNGGELCYVLAIICHEYLREKGERYATYGEVRHALATTWEEVCLPRMKLYEQSKKNEHGDIP